LHLYNPSSKEVMHVARLRENHRKRWALLLLLVAVVLATAGGLAAVKAVAATSGHQSQAQAVKVAQLIKSGHVAKGAQGTECTSGPGKLCWDGKKGAGACPAGTTGRKPDGYLVERRNRHLHRVDGIRARAGLAHHGGHRRQVPTAVVLCGIHRDAWQQPGPDDLRVQ
jgi:hypothetical protein